MLTLQWVVVRKRRRKGRVLQKVIKTLCSILIGLGVGFLFQGDNVHKMMGLGVEHTSHRGVGPMGCLPECALDNMLYTCQAKGSVAGKLKTDSSPIVSDWISFIGPYSCRASQASVQNTTRTGYIELCSTPAYDQLTGMRMQPLWELGRPYAALRLYNIALHEAVWVGQNLLGSWLGVVVRWLRHACGEHAHIWLAVGLAVILFRVVVGVWVRVY